LRYFFSNREKDTARLFDGLAVSEIPEVMAAQGEYPTIFVSLKGIRGTDWATARAAMADQIARQYQLYEDIREGADGFMQRRFDAVLNGDASDAALAVSLRDLISMLYRHYEKPALVLVDEYDTPILEAYRGGYYDEMISFMRSWLGEGLKYEDEPALFKAVLTGIMRVAKESLFSGLNNFAVYPAHMASPFNPDFGFTEDEVKTLLSLCGQRDKLVEVREWYNGYDFGRARVYNPWSIVNYLNSECEPAAYWINTSSNDEIYEIVRDASPALRDDPEQLIAGRSIARPVTEAAVLRDGAQEQDIWSFLLGAGYLMAKNPRDEFGESLYDLSIPNREVRRLFGASVRRWLEPVLPLNANRRLVLSLLKGDFDVFEKELAKLVLNLLSYHDLARRGERTPEAVIQAFTLGLLASLAGDYRIRSNRETGAGRADIIMIPRKRGEAGFVIEFKAIDESADMDSALRDALAQIEEKQYAAEALADGVSKVRKLAIALQGKTVKVREGA